MKTQADPELLATVITKENPPANLSTPPENPAPAPVQPPPAPPEPKPVEPPPVASTPPPAPPPASGATVVSDADLLSDPPPIPGQPIIDPPPIQTDEQKRGRGRPVGSKTKRPDFTDLTPVDYTGLASHLVDMSTGMAAGMLGPEWHPRTPEEKKMLVTSLANYLKAKEVKDIPPGWMLVIVVSAYSLPRMSAPSTKQKLGYGWHWLKGKLIWIFRRKRPNLTEVFKDGTI